MPEFIEKRLPSRPRFEARRNRLSFRCLIFLGAISCLAMASSANDFQQPEPLEPAVADASDEAVEAMSAIRIPEPWKIELFAAEPDVANVVAFDIDHRGRVFVCETFRQNRGVTDNRGHDEQWLLADLAAETVQDRIDYHKRLLGEAAITYAQHDDRIRRLDDVDGDGKADKSYVLANGFNRLEEGTGAGILVRGDTVFYTNIPKLWKLVDNDDDGSAEQRIAMSDGYGVRVAFRGHDMHGLVMGPDGRIYFSIGDRGYHVTTADGRLLANPESGAVFRCELDGTGLEVFATGLRNPQELAFNDHGDLFSVDNNSDSGDQARIVHILEGSDAGWRMHYQYLPDRGPFNRERIWEPLHPEQPAYIVPPVANLTDGPSGLTYYPGTGFGDTLNNTFLICDFRGGPANSGIRSFQLSPSGAFYQLAKDSDPIWTVLATDIDFGPDGALYVSDWVDGWDGLGKGRIYRITDPRHVDSATVADVQQRLAGDWSARADSELASDLAHQDRRVRFEAQWELAKRGQAEIFMKVASDADAATITRVHAIWGLDQIIRRDPETLSQTSALIKGLLESEDAIVRAAAAKLAGERGDQAALAKLTSLISDEHPRVRYFATRAVSKLKGKDAIQPVLAMIAKNAGADPAIRHAGIVFLSGLGDENVAKLSQHPSASVRRAAVVALRRRRSSRIQDFLADAKPLVVSEAARAIHDVPIPAAMNRLAEMLDERPEDPELVRRILNANYRVGNPESAARIATFAAGFGGSEEMRIEALDMLTSWGQPDPRDRVLGVYRPLEPRAPKVAAEALAPHVDTLMTAEEAVKEKAIDTASVLGLKKIVPLLIERVSNSEERPTLRASALKALSRLDSARAVGLAREIKSMPATALVPVAMSVLAKYDAANSIDRFIAATSSRDVQVRQMAWDILARLEDPKAQVAIAGGVRDYLDGSLPADVHLNLIEAAQGKVGPELSQSLTEHARSLAQSDALGPWLASLEGGDPTRGERIFHEKTEVSCLRCHKIDRAGGEVGPNLTTIGKQRDRRYLLESICLPDAQIAKGFETAVIATDLGQVFTGIVKAENDDFIELIQNDGSQQRILVDEIIARKKGKSSMPADLIKQLSRRELRDLVAYLAGLQVDPRAADATE